MPTQPSFDAIFDHQPVPASPAAHASITVGEVYVRRLLSKHLLQQPIPQMVVGRQPPTSPKQPAQQAAFAAFDSPAATANFADFANFDAATSTVAPIVNSAASADPFKGLFTSPPTANHAPPTATAAPPPVVAAPPPPVSSMPPAAAKPPPGFGQRKFTACTSLKNALCSTSTDESRDASNARASVGSCHSSASSTTANKSSRQDADTWRQVLSAGRTRFHVRRWL